MFSTVNLIPSDDVSSILSCGFNDVVLKLTMPNDSSLIADATINLYVESSHKPLIDMPVVFVVAYSSKPCVTGLNI